VLLGVLLLVRGSIGETSDGPREQGNSAPEAFIPSAGNWQTPAISLVENTATFSRTSSTLRLAKAWNHVLDDLRGTQNRFSDDENDALDAILLQVQSGLISIDLKPAQDATAPNSRRAIEQLVPNTTALTAFFKRKHLQHPEIGEFRRLSANAQVLAEETNRMAPLVGAVPGH
jgi:hypothetical protein